MATERTGFGHSGGKHRRKRGPLEGQLGKHVAKRKPAGEEWVVDLPDDMNPILLDAVNKMNPKQVALFSAWVINGRNVSAAARQVGYHPQHARTLFKSHSGFLEAKNYLKDIVLLEDQEWIDCLPQARQTLRSLLNARDEKVRLWAAKDIVDRAEGKPTTRVDMTIRDERPSLSDGQLQLVISIMQTTGVSFAEAKAHVEAHPDEAERWIASNVTKSLPATARDPAKDIVDAAEVPPVTPEPPEDREALESLLRPVSVSGVSEVPPGPPSPADAKREALPDVLRPKPRRLIAYLDAEA
jgi:hypothetical protein